MSPFNIDQFAHQLLTEALFYDEEYGALGNVSLIDIEAARERYLASYDPDRNIYLIEKATDWEECDEVDYMLTIDGQEYGAYRTPEEAAEELMRLATDGSLKPVFMVLYNEEG